MTTLTSPDENLASISSDPTDADSRAGHGPGEEIGTEQLALGGVVIVAMTVIATFGFTTIFSSDSFFLVALVGAALGALVVVVGRRMNLLFGEVVGIGLLAPLVLGPIATGGTGFYQGLVFGWSDILSATPPVDPTPGLLALPFIAAFAGALIATELFRIRDLPGLAVVGPLGTLTLTALFSEQIRTGAIAVGLVLLIGMLVLARLHYRSVSSTGLLVLGVVLGLVAALASLASVALPYGDEERRFDLRQFQVPPWNPLSVPSPLVEVKDGLTSVDQQPVLRLRGDVPVDRWRIASLPSYNGVFWGVSEPNQTTEFVAVDTFLPGIGDEQGGSAGQDRLIFDVDIVQPLGPWVPVAGVPERLFFNDETDVRMSVETGTIAIPDGLQPGNSYQLTVSPFVSLDDSDLANHRFVSESGRLDAELLQPVVRNLAADFSTGIEPFSGERVLAIRDSLQLGSYDLDRNPGHSFGNVASFVQEVQVGQGAPDDVALRVLLGSEEIYAATGALMTRLSDIPVRVAVGYVVPDERWADRSAEVFASDINAWIEVHIEGQGWMPVDVTPDRERQPEDTDEGPSATESRPFPDDPVPPPSADEGDEPEIEEPEDPEEPDEEEDDEPDEEIVVGLTAVRLLTGGAVAGLGSVLALALGVIGYKGLRRRRRRNADRAAARISGAWAELVDRIDEAGGDLPMQATPSQAASYAQTLPDVGDQVQDHIRQLADHVNIAAFHPNPPTEQDAVEAWQTYDEVVNVMNEAAGPTGRFRRAIDPRTLRESVKVGAR